MAAWRWIRVPIRPLVLNRHDEGAAACPHATLGHEQGQPNAYLKATLEAIAAGHPASDIDLLLPWAFTPISR